MSDELKRVGLVFKADGTVDFNKSLKAVNASIQENRSAFKLAKSSWDDSTKSVEKLRETQKYLENQTKDYTDKVRMLETELKELESAENRDEKAISKKKDQLNTAQTSLNNYQKGLDEVSQKLDSGAAEIEEYGKKLEEMGGKMTSAGKKMSKGITAPVLAVGAAGVKSAMELDEGYDTIISKTGATGDKLLEMQDIADEVFGGMPVSMMDVGAAVGEINTRFEFTGDVLKEATKKFLKFAEINETDVNTAVQLVSRAIKDKTMVDVYNGEIEFSDYRGNKAVMRVFPWGADSAQLQIVPGNQEGSVTRYLSVTPDEIRSQNKDITLLAEREIVLMAQKVSVGDGSRTYTTLNGRAEFSDGTYLEFVNGSVVGGNAKETGAF